MTEPGSHARRLLSGIHLGTSVTPGSDDQESTLLGSQMDPRDYRGYDGWGQA